MENEKNNLSHRTESISWLQPKWSAVLFTSAQIIDNPERYRCKFSMSLYFVQKLNPYLLYLELISSINNYIGWKEKPNVRRVVTRLTMFSCMGY